MLTFNFRNMAAKRKGGAKGKGEKHKSTINEVITKECTINIHKRIHGMYVAESLIL